jgi:hypothetical protein
MPTAPPTPAHVLDQLEFAPDRKYVMHLEMLSVGACGLHEQVAGAEAEQPVAEQVAAPLCDDHPHGVVGHLAAADFLADQQLAGAEECWSSSTKMDKIVGVSGSKRRRGGTPGLVPLVGPTAFRVGVPCVAPASSIELRLVFFENQFNDTVIVLGSETIAMRPHELGTSIFGLLACRVEPDHLSPDSGYAQVQVALSGDCAKLVRHRVRRGF